MENKRSKVIRKKISNNILRKRNFRKKQKRKLFFKRCYIIITLLSIVGVVIYGLAVVAGNIFCVKEIFVEGNSLYSDTEILNALSIHRGEGLLFLNTSESEKNLYKFFPYIDNVIIQKQFPSKINITIETAERTFSIFKDDVYYIFSAKGKLIEKTSEPPSEVIELRVSEFEIDENGRIDYADDDVKELVTEIRNEFLNSGIGNIKIIDLTNKGNIIVNYDDRINIIIGNREDLHYKIVTAKEIISNKINKFEKGELDLRHLSKENKSYFVSE